VFRLDNQEDVNTIWLSETPQPQLEPILGDEWTSKLDSGFERFFTRASLRRKDLVHRPYCVLKHSLNLFRQEVSELGESDLKARLEVPEQTEIHLNEARPRKDASTFLEFALMKSVFAVTTGCRIRESAGFSAELHCTR
jgi:hypothetical protein